MDIASVIGFLAAVSMFFWSLWTGSGGQVGAYWDTASVILVLGGAIFTVLVTQPLDKYLTLFRVCGRAFFSKPRSVSKTIEKIVQMGEMARREGVLSLEQALHDVDDPFLANGVRLVIDGTAAGEIEQILNAECEAVDQRHGQGKAILDLFAKYAPAFGMIGTLMGLVAMLMNMDDPKKIGPGMAVAILTTLYGAVVANMICLPMADKLSYRNDEEMLLRTIIIKGILSLQAGDNPRVTLAKLSVYLPIRERERISGPGSESKKS